MLILQQKNEAEMAPKSLNDHSKVFITGNFACGVPYLTPSLFIMCMKVSILKEAEDIISGRSTVVNFALVMDFCLFFNNSWKCWDLFIIVCFSNRAGRRWA